MKSKYNCICKKCYRAIYIGDEITKAPTYWKHADCKAVRKRQPKKLVARIRSANRGVRLRTGA